ncbi:MAG TPA: hypothetical protein VFM74_01120, partial [Candidatus Limnocylindria bacterium]|nr:hypothetical protein [Candidatus Limnocylindria bacterium]
MIGNRRPPLTVVAGALAPLVLGLLFCLRPADPAIADPATAARLDADISAQAAAADTALHRLATEVEQAIDAGRAGAAATASGDVEPGPRLDAAADRLQAAAAPLDAAQRALAQLAGLLAAR